MVALERRTRSSVIGRHSTRLQRAVCTVVVIVVVGCSPAIANPINVWKDPAGDAEFQGHAIPEAHRLGLLDLVSGSIDRKGPDLVFSVTHSAMPDFGALPEGARFMWYFVVDEDSYTNHYFLTAKRLEIAAAHSPSRVYLDGFFSLEKDCGYHVEALELRTCGPLAYLSGTFDPSKRSMSISVPLSAIGARKGSLIWAGQPSTHIPATGARRVCTICWVTHVGERSGVDDKIDRATMTGAYRIPKR